MSHSRLYPTRTHKTPSQTFSVQSTHVLPHKQFLSAPLDVQTPWAAFCRHSLWTTPVDRKNHVLVLSGGEKWMGLEGSCSRQTRQGEDWTQGLSMLDVAPSAMLSLWLTHLLSPHFHSLLACGTHAVGAAHSPTGSLDLSLAP